MKVLDKREIETKLEALPDWELDSDGHLHCELSFPDFVQALDFVNQVGEIAEEQEHHPNIFLTWGKVELTVWTHSEDGITEKDFEFAKAVTQLD